MKNEKKKNEVAIECRLFKSTGGWWGAPGVGATVVTTLFFVSTLVIKISNQ